WTETVLDRLRQIMTLLEQDQPAAARQRVNEWVAEWLRQSSAGVLQALAPVQVDLDTSAPNCTRLKVTSQDTPAFLYAFSTGLALQRVSIERVRIATDNRILHDEIDVLGA